MTKLSFTFAAFTAAAMVAYAQTPTIPICTLAALTPPSAPANGESELVNDVVLTCTSTAPSQSALINITLFLSVNLTSRVTNPTTMASEALLLIDEPLPGVANTSNGFPYFGQVLGTSGILAGSPGSGNVYQGTQAVVSGGVQDNVIQWLAVPYVTGGTRTFRLTNIRANISNVGINPVNAEVSISGPVALEILGPEVQVATGATALNVTSSPLIGAIGLDVSVAELFPNAFKKRIENTSGGPLTVAYQDVPGTPYCTQSGFTPEFVSLTPGAIGLADTGTRLLVTIKNIPPAAFILIVRDQVASSSGELVAHRVLPPFASNFTGGTVSTGTGDSLVLVSGHSAEVLYEVTAASPFLGVNGCGALDTFHVSVLPILPVPMKTAVVTGQLAPIDPTSQMSPTAPEPRFQP